MMLTRLSLNKREHAIFRAVEAFLSGRLEERASVDWALKLKPDDSAKRSALLFLINKDGLTIREPWRTAWYLIDEWLTNPEGQDYDLAHAFIHKRLKAGDRSGSIVTAIAKSVEPRLHLVPFSALDRQYQKLSRDPKKVEELFSIRLKTGKMIDGSLLDEISKVQENSFFLSLANSLDAGVTKGFDIARFLGWLGHFQSWRLGQLDRVYYLFSSERNRVYEPDQFHEGITPSVKLLHRVLEKLADIDCSFVIEFTRRWKYAVTPVHLRLWAALSRDSRITPSREVAEWLLGLKDTCFWKIDEYPEIAELRAVRFREFSDDEQAQLVSRIQKLPPRTQWPKKADVEQVKKGRLYASVSELRRIEVAGATLPKKGKSWLDERIIDFPDLQHMTRLDHDFPQGVQVFDHIPNPDNQFDFLSGRERLKSLADALSAPYQGLNDNHAERASDWIHAQGNSLKILDDFESVPDSVSAFKKVWGIFSRAHSPQNGDDEVVANNNLQQCHRVLALLFKLPQSTLQNSIDGITSWLSRWKKQVVRFPECLSFCLRLWPLAVEAINAERPVSENVLFLTESDEKRSDQKPEARNQPPDTLNNPAGELVMVFLTACPNLGKNKKPFDGDGELRTLRDLMVSTLGRAGLVARLHMIENLSYFQNADHSWTNEYLIKPLNVDSQEAIYLWQAVAQQTRYWFVLRIIGSSMMERVADMRISRNYRQSFIFSLVFETLHAFLENRDPAVRIQQMLRSLDDEDRAYAAGVIRNFVSAMSNNREDDSIMRSTDEIFCSAAIPFLKKVWPQERSLATSGVSRALANLPVTAKQVFAEAVNTIERFLVPFDCWTLSDYGLFESKLSIIDSEEKAEACLRLFDHTIGTSENVVFPYDLADALDHIRKVAPKLGINNRFRRLETLARRG